MLINGKWDLKRSWVNTYVHDQCIYLSFIDFLCFLNPQTYKWNRKVQVHVNNTSYTVQQHLIKLWPTAVYVWYSGLIDNTCLIRQSSITLNYSCTSGFSRKFEVHVHCTWRQGRISSSWCKVLFLLNSPKTVHIFSLSSYCVYNCTCRSRKQRFLSVTWASGEPCYNCCTVCEWCFNMILTNGSSEVLH